MIIKNKPQEKSTYNFSNALALIIVLLCFIYFFWISYPSKQSANRDIGEVKTAMISLLTLVIGYYFGSNKSATIKDDKIEALQQNAATTAIDMAADKAQVKADIKIDKVAKIAELKLALKDLEPDSDEAKNLLKELELLEKIS